MADQTQTQPSKSQQSADAAKDTAGTAKAKAGDVAGTASDQASAVAETTKQQARTLAEEANRHAGNVLGSATDEMNNQAGQRLEQLAQSSRTTSDQLRALVDGRPEDAGSLPDIAADLADRLGRVSDHIDRRGVQGVTEDVAGFARRRPLMFLAGAGFAGFLAGRLAQGARSASGDGSSDSSGASGGASGESAEASSGEAPAVAGMAPGAGDIAVPSDTVPGDVVAEPGRIGSTSQVR